MPFPRARARGLIEDVGHVFEEVAWWPFPRARARGLIEDAWKLGAARARAENFRGHVPAASLKRRTPLRRCNAPKQFPRARARGLIEEPRLPQLRRPKAYFRGHVPAASLKTHALVYNRHAIDISAGTCPRPH